MTLGKGVIIMIFFNPPLLCRAFNSPGYSFSVLWVRVLDQSCDSNKQKKLDSFLRLRSSGFVARS